MRLLQGLSKIRVRLAVGFVAAFLGMALFGVLSYSYFLGMEQKLVFLSQADGMVNMALEARRYEKNYFLYRHDQDFHQTLDYLNRFEAMLEADRDHLVRGHGEAAITGLQKLSADYRRRFVWLHDHFGGDAGVAKMDQAVSGLRASGKELIQRLEVLARSERQGITDLLREYRPLLVAFLVLLRRAGGHPGLRPHRRAWIRPLQIIEEATEVVAHGDYQTIPWAKHRDEIGSLVQAFNRMVTQLRHNNEQMIQTEKTHRPGHPDQRRGPRTQQPAQQHLHLLPDPAGRGGPRGGRVPPRAFGRHRPTGGQGPRHRQLPFGVRPPARFPAAPGKTCAPWWRRASS